MKPVIHPPNILTSRPPGHGLQPLGRPKSPIPVITDRQQNQSRAGDRGLKITWMPGYAPIYNPGNKGAALAITTATPNGAIPGDAVAGIVVVTLSTNTTTAGTFTIHFYADTTSSGGDGVNGAVASFEGINGVSTSNSFRTQLIVPLVQGSFRFDITVTGAVNYAPQISHVGWLRG